MTAPSDSLEDRRQKPWAMVENELLRDPRISPQCKALYGLLITYGPNSIFPGQETLAHCLGTTRQTVKRWLDDLKLQGLIDWENRTGTSNKYYILGHANMVGVTPTLQGCNTHVTGGVTPTLHDLEPLILNQELEEPALPDSPSELLLVGPEQQTATTTVTDSSATVEGESDIEWHTPTASQEAAEQRHARMCDELGTDPLQVAAVVEKKRAEAVHPDGGDPQHDGDLWMGRPVQEWCAFIRLPYSEQSAGRKAMLAADLRTIATGDGLHKTPDETGAAIRQMTTSDSCEWMRSAGRPTHSGFAETLINVLCGQRLPDGKRNGGASGGRKEPEPPPPFTFVKPDWLEVWP